MAEGVGNPVYDSFNEGQPLEDVSTWSYKQKRLLKMLLKPKQTQELVQKKSRSSSERKPKLQLWRSRTAFANSEEFPVSLKNHPVHNHQYLLPVCGIGREIPPSISVPRSRGCLSPRSSEFFLHSVPSRFFYSCPQLPRYAVCCMDTIYFIIP